MPRSNTPIARPDPIGPERRTSPASSPQRAGRVLLYTCPLMVLDSCTVPGHVTLGWLLYHLRTIHEADLRSKDLPAPAGVNKQRKPTAANTWSAEDEAWARDIIARQKAQRGE